MKSFLFARKLTLIAAAMAAITMAHGQTVSISSNGADVHKVLKSLFDQGKKSYVIEPGVYFAGYFDLTNVEFDEALGIVCHLAKLEVAVRDGIYYISRAHGMTPSLAHETREASSGSEPARKDSKPSKPAAATTVNNALLYRRKVSVRFKKTEIKAVFGELGRQSNIAISMDPKVPAYRLDVVLKGTSLLYALDKISKAVGLVYKVRGHDVWVGLKEHAPKG